MKLILSSPLGTGQCTSHHKIATALTGIHCLKHGVGFEMQDVIGCSPIEAARAIQLARFMASDASHILMVDYDIGWQPETVIRLLQLNKHFLGAAYPLRGSKIQQFCYRSFDRSLDVDYYPDTSLLRVEAIGTGFMMLTRHAVESMFRAYTNFKIDDSRMAENERPFLYDLFREQYAIDPDLPYGGKRLEGEDYSFCNRWRAIGGEIFLDPHAKMLHGNQVEYVEARLWDTLNDEFDTKLGSAA